MKRGVIPKHLHFEDPNPHIDWDRLPVQVVSALTDWPSHPDHPPRAGVSAFGISGTNAHVVVEGYDSPDATPVGSAQPVSLSVVDLIDEEETFAPRQTRLPAPVGKIRRGTSRPDRTLFVVARRARIRRCGPACRHGVDSRCGTQPFRSPRGHRIPRCRIPAREITSTRRDRSKTRAAYSDKGRLRVHRDRATNGLAWVRNSTKASR